MALLGLASCGGGNNAANARADWHKSLQDSIQDYQTRISECDNRIKSGREEVGVWLRDFVSVNNPREVEGYIIFHGWENRYPLTSTGLVARISENGALELMAANKKPFDRISVVTPTTTITSDVVPNDQALNYRTAELTTVMFSGAKADSVAMVIADNQLNNIKVIYMGANPVGEWSIPNDYKKMIADTYMLYSKQRQVNSLEREVVLLNQKIALVRAQLDKDTQKSEK